MDKITSADLSKYSSGTTALDVAYEICRDFGWNPAEKMEISLVELLCEKLQPSSLVLKPKDVSPDELVAQHQARGESVATLVKSAVKAIEYPVMDMISIPMLKERLSSLHSAFRGSHFNHAVAVKANPVRSVLRMALASGCGAECASFCEVKHALSLGFTPRSVVFDSPCKTYQEIYDAIIADVYINLDNLDEVEKVEKVFQTLYSSSAELLEKHRGQIGIRINPVVGTGSIASTSTANSASKFGLPLTSATKQTLLTLFEKHAWLQGIHVHVGSQGCPMDLLVIGAKRAVEFAAEVNKHVGRDQIHVLDIGGGMPTVYDGLPQSDLSYASYAEMLKDQVPEVFSGQFKIITEFGRSVFVKSGCTITRVESMKQWANQNIAVVHVGANQFLRTAYLPQAWPHTFSVFSSQGLLKKGPLVKQDIAGPLCFSGDFLAKEILLPQLEVGDYIVIHDTGAYTVAMYSKYNSRPSTAIYGYETSPNGEISFTIFKDQENTEQVLSFWGV
ncbi:diaminopimelate decarboxylase [Thraustotheca clavata]|uniref:Diaminopimelate decarboxylase n=1 Tax=Thraustotheca clavata TaxID=74557 RepID=A0A1V9YUM8_9STRA|nr:diaminopimelate decarboxylase [Thraustotheca clavata]